MAWTVWQQRRWGRLSWFFCFIKPHKTAPLESTKASGSFPTKENELYTHGRWKQKIIWGGGGQIGKGKGFFLNKPKKLNR